MLNVLFLETIEFGYNIFELSVIFSLIPFLPISLLFIYKNFNMSNINININNNYCASCNQRGHSRRTNSRCPLNPANIANADVVIITSEADDNVLFFFFLNTCKPDLILNYEFVYLHVG